MLPFGILWPTFALVALVFAVWVTVAVKRLGYMKGNPPRRESFSTGDEMRRYFAPVELANDNLSNLFQMPVLFLALVPLLLLTRQADHVQVVLAWAFVALRAAHSLIHIQLRNVRARFLVFVLSCAVLSAMWIGFFVDIVTAADAYHTAMNGMPQP